MARTTPTGPHGRIFMTPTVRSLFIAWQEPESRRIFPVARLMRRRSGEYELRYIGAVWAARERGFLGLPGFEDLETIHVTATLPELFARSAARRRAAPADPREVSGEQLDAAPITLFVRRERGGPPERLEAFSPPLRAPDGRRWGVFEARGVGRGPGSAELAATLVPGERLELRPEPHNPYNPQALSLLRADGSPIGYAPDYFANELAAVGGNAEQIELTLIEAQRVTFAPAPVVYRVSCRYACAAELGRALFTSDSYRPVPPRAQPSSSSAV